MNRFQYLLPKSAGDAAAALKAGGAPKAGGIDLLDRMKEGIAAPERLVNLLALEDAALRGIALDAAGGARIGALATLAEIAANEALAERFPALAHAAGEAATPQVRNAATAGGNLLQAPRCWYFRLAEFDCPRRGGDGPCPAVHGENKYHAIVGYERCPSVHPSNLAPALVALRAAVRVHGRPAPVPVEELWPADGSADHRLEKGEFLTAIEVPPSGPNAFVEIREKQSFDWALAQAAVARAADGRWRVVLGAVAPIPWRSAPAEKILGDADLDDERIGKAAAAAVEGAKPLSGNAYKVALARVAVKRALLAAGGMR